MGHDVMSAAVELMFIVYMHVLIYLSVAWGIFYVYMNINSIHAICSADSYIAERSLPRSL